MAIIEKKKNELASKNLTPISISIGSIEDVKNRLEYANVELEKNQEVVEMNVKLAMKYNQLQEKYNLTKHELDNQIKHNIQYQKITKKLNFILLCPFLQMPITIYECNEKCSKEHCAALYDCAKRIMDIKIEYKIP